MNVRLLLICSLSALSVAIFAQFVIRPVFVDPVSTEAASGPALQIALADGAQTRERFAKSTYSFIWDHDLLFGLRKDLKRSDARNKQQEQLSVVDLLSSLECVRINCHDFEFGSATDKLNLSGQIAAGDYTASIWKLLLKNAEEIPAIAGADKSLRREDGLRAALFGNTIVAATSSAALPPVSADATNLATVDVSGSLHMGNFY